MKEARTQLPEGVTRVVNSATGEIKMVKEHVKDVAIANGFKLKEQPSGEMDLNPYVYQFANALCNQQATRIDELTAALAELLNRVDEDLVSDAECVATEMAFQNAINVLSGATSPAENEAAQQDLILDCLDMQFSNLTKQDDERFPVYTVKDEHGNQVDMITYLGKGEWRIYIDNFPSRKKYYAFNLPVKTVADLVADMARIGLKLIPQPPQGESKQ